MEFVPLIRHQRADNSFCVNVCLYVFILWALQLMNASEPARAKQENSDPSVEVESDRTTAGSWILNLNTKTRGGQQFWTDLRHASGWRVQRNEVTGHHRLIDDKNYRITWGTLDQCNNQLDKAIKSGDAKLHEGELVIVLHGLLRSRRSMNKLTQYLQSHGKYQVINFEYASSRKEVAVHAAALQQIIDSLGPKVTRIHFVAHSLGNLVIRHYLKDTSDAKTGAQGDPRIGRIVMIGPPNQGSKMAEWLKNSFLFNTIAGASGAQLSRHWSELEPKLATPRQEFGIIAGGQSKSRKVSNMILQGPDDFTVRTEETRLVGARDFLVKPLFHSTMMNQPPVLEATLRFLKQGYFVSASQKRPITTLQED